MNGSEIDSLSSTKDRDVRHIHTSVGEIRCLHTTCKHSNDASHRLQGEQ